MTDKPSPGARTFAPFADDVAVQTIGGLSLENGRDAIAVHGSLDLTRDRAGLDRARALQAAVTAIVEALSGSDLPEAAEATVAEPTIVRNPFA
ncbi:hypothetical protein [Methylobacterium gossipiicola]|uniref:Uncharacterized protein n=1 Tax=Methylobacterium gossipiicola TaxID=582675 RepID=A0A1I2XK69_9HYPH|nr:hypothetical protein [Methylobacterium gossipiicola]SFH13477.1 hypothetical protein SAMN05192565_1458 [Methylobacterium gossipiicola]